MPSQEGSNYYARTSRKNKGKIFEGEQYMIVQVAAFSVRCDGCSVFLTWNIPESKSFNKAYIFNSINDAEEEMAIPFIYQWETIDGKHYCPYCQAERLEEG